MQATSLVEIDVSRRPLPDLDMDWSGVQDRGGRGQVYEFLTQTAASEPPAELAELAEAIAAANGPHAGRSGDLRGRPRGDDLRARLDRGPHPGRRGVGGPRGASARTTRTWSWARCVTSGCPRATSRATCTRPRTPEIGVVTSGESHAWVEWWLGEWAAHDPTNSSDVGERHIMIGTGRDYNDVPPIKGIVAGTKVSAQLSVSVDLVRLA